ncbi:MAG: putative 2-aminoethylphosphonate ABC transporter ATP-binding protein [Burkholderiales bacterium]|nr:putative 2-aminoethylphosphonate ABC transporter ATP-binding protein [Burkholderiales bacterium]
MNVSHSSPTEQTFLHVAGITKRFGKFEALREIDLDVGRGELVVFLGPSGCGKTTLLRIIAGLETQDAGTIVQDGRDVSRLPAIKRDYGIVFQSYALFPNLTIHDNVAYGLVNRRQGRKLIESRVRELLMLVGLPDSGAKYPGQMSGGQQQRIALARALATSPGLLLLDEPLSALDAIERVRLRGEIRALQQRLAVTTVMVTHDQEEALSMADRIVVMNAGRIEQVGTPREIYSAPGTPFVADFVGKINMLTAIAESGGRCRVGSLSLAIAKSGLVPGTAIRLYLRPEEIGIHANGAAPAGALPARIAKVEFLGAFCLVGLELAGDDVPVLVANVPRQVVDGAGLASGLNVRISLPPEAMRVLG